MPGPDLSAMLRQLRQANSEVAKAEAELARLQHELDDLNNHTLFRINELIGRSGHEEDITFLVAAWKHYREDIEKDIEKARRKVKEAEDSRDRVIKGIERAFGM
jgi:predicted  nucleic acid-binding Zn-ribbon protein